MITALPLIPDNAFDPTLLIFFDLIVKDFSFSHPLNAWFPIFVTLTDTVTDLRFLLSSKAFAPIEVSLYLNPSTVTLSGSFADLTLVDALTYSTSPTLFALATLVTL